MATASRSRTRRAKSKSRMSARPVARISRTKRPEEMPLEQWQRELRRQFGRSQKFALKRIGEEPVFSEFHVTNPQSGNTYRVAIRGTEPGENFCSCPDFATNLLGTCKHVEFTLGRLAAMRGGKKALSQGFQPPYSEIFLQYGGERAVRFRAGTEAAKELVRVAHGPFDDEGRLTAEGFQAFYEFLDQARHVDPDLRVYADALDFAADVRDASQRAERLQKAFPRGIRSAAFKNLLKVNLYDYQREGALFACRAGRALIADEMGLGKTIQAIASAEIMAREFGIERVLVICPTSLKHQWEREIQKFTDRSVQVIGGLQPERSKQFKGDAFFKVTNYDTVHRDLPLIAELQPDLVILDEAQRIKNWTTRVANAVKKIRSPYAVVLTGTPLENRLEELASIVQFVDLHRLGPAYRFLHDHQLTDETGRVVGYRDLDRIGKTLEPILIRRAKSEVLKQLPERIDKTLFVPMTKQQRDHHEAAKEIVAKLVSKWRRVGFLTEADQRRLMAYLQMMRMSCDSTYLIDEKTDHGHKADELAQLLDETYERPNTKVVIFSQWVRMHEMVRRRFEHRAWDYVLFHGGVESKKRRGLVDRFREDEKCRAFLATDAGGVGLNLQHANMVVNLDLPWNPAVLEQRIGRVHRMGQQQPVQVFNFVAQGTIEEGMLGVLQFKKSLASGVLDGGESEILLGGSRLKKFIETVEQVTGQIPAAAPDEPIEAPFSVEPADEAPRAKRTRSGGRQRRLPAPEATPPTAPPADPLSGLLQTGLVFLEQLTQATREQAPADSNGGRAASSSIVQIDRDPATGASYLRLPVPEPETLNRFLESLGGLLAQFRR
jgi:superfamily II DNA or RNA helicase